MSKIDIDLKINNLEKMGILSPRIARIERRLIPIIEKMENNGIKIDPDRFDIIEDEISDILEDLRKKIFDIVGREFIINSPTALSHVLFNELKIPTYKFGKTEKGKISISTTNLKNIKNDYQIIEYIIEYRKLYKLYSNYIKILPNLADKNYRVKSSYDQLGTATGRLSSSRPNLQNIASHSEVGKKIRNAFVSEKGYSFLSIDYSQVELRLAAHITQEKSLLQSFENNEDIHTITASKVFGIPMNEVDEDLRFKAKFLNFGVLYGMSPYGFARVANCPVYEAEEYINNYYAKLPNIYSYTQNIISSLQKNGYVDTLWGRRRFLPKIYSTNFKEKSTAKRMAINHPIQGTAADIIKKAMIDVDIQVLKKHSEIRLLSQIHDELLFEIKDEDVYFFAPILRNIIEQSTQFDDIFLKTDVEIGKNLNNLQKLK
jgi:DNA polymerase I